MDIDKIFRQKPVGVDKNSNVVFGKKFQFEGKDIFDLRESYGVSQSCFSELAGKNKSWGAEMESFGIHTVTLKTMLRLCQIFGILEGIKKAKDVMRRS
jgi:hypothetical protein